MFKISIKIQQRNVKEFEWKFNMDGANFIFII